MTLPTSETLRERAVDRPRETPRRSERSPLAVKSSTTRIMVADKTQELVVASGRWESLYGLLCSLGVHLALVCLLGFLAFETSDRSEVGVLSGVIGSPDTELPAEFILDAVHTPDSGGSEDPVDDVVPAVALHEIGTAASVAPTFGGGTGEGEGAGEGDGIGVAVPAINVPSYAVTKGSFSAWTVPEDPEPGKSYVIMIQVRLPSHLQKGKVFPAKDITGMVTGTDGYRRVIKFKPNDKVDVQDGAVQFELTIPGAAQMVKDTIRIESKLLKEKQVMKLVF